MTVTACSIDFDETIKGCIKFFGLEGKVIHQNNYREYSIDVVYLFAHRYLQVHDSVSYEMGTGVSRASILNRTVRHLDSIRFQFKAYFNELWC